MRLLYFVLFAFVITSCTKDDIENKPPVVNAGTDITITLAKSTDSVRLVGSATDADGSVVSYLWAQVSGPGTPTIATPASSTTYVKGFVSGTYEFQLMATDDKGAVGVKSVKVTVTVTTVIGDNLPPVVNAGPDVTATLTKTTDSIRLTGSATDPDGTVASYLWSQVSGPNTPTITTPGSPSTYVKGFVTGIYVFQLTATDNKGATGVKTVQLNVTVPTVVTLSLSQPSADTYLGYFEAYGGNSTNSNSPEIGAASWTSAGLPATVRGLLKFDLSSIPAGATITSAKLSLYSTATPLNGDLVHANAGPDNAMLIQRALGNWSEATTTWGNQPAGDAASQIVIPHTNQAFLDLVDVDVTNQVRSMVTGTNNGFLLKLQTEAIYNSRLFYSRKAPDASKRPKLIVQYSN
jgi:hypothetical protein